MMRGKLVTMSLCLSVLAFGAASHAGEKQPIEGKAPAKAAPKREATSASAKGPYDLGTLDPIDVPTSRAIDVLAKSCLMSELSREGPTREETAKCNAAVGSVAAQGKKGASAILAALNDPDFPPRRYGRTRLYGVLGKIDDEKVRGAIIEGLATVAREKLTAHARHAYEVDRTLRAMAGGGPEVAIPWDGKATVKDPIAEVAESAVAWRSFQKANEGKTRAQITQEVLARARTEKKSDDPKTAYRAIEALVQHAPKEALGAVKAYRKRGDLPKDVAAAFETLEARIGYEVESTSAAKAAS